MFENGAGLVIERAVAILTQTSLKHSIAAVANHRFATATWAIDPVTPENLFVGDRAKHVHTLPAATNCYCWAGLIGYQLGFWTVVTASLC